MCVVICFGHNVKHVLFGWSIATLGSKHSVEHLPRVDLAGFGSLVNLFSFNIAFILIVLWLLWGTLLKHSLCKWKYTLFEVHTQQKCWNSSLFRSLITYAMHAEWVWIVTWALVVSEFCWKSFWCLLFLLSIVFFLYRGAFPWFRSHQKAAKKLQTLD